MPKTTARAKTKKTSGAQKTATAKKLRPKKAILLPKEEVLEETENEQNEDIENPEEFSGLDSTALTPRDLDHTDLPKDLGDHQEFDDSQLPASTDPLKRYFQEVQRYPLLSPEEEFELAIKLRDTGDIHAAKRLVTANLRLVVKIAMEYKNYYTNLLDLIQEGNVGLMKAVSKFDPTKGARLGYYSSWWIRSYILKYLLDNFRLVKIGTTQAQKKLFYHLMREKEKLEAQGIAAGPKLLADKLNVREQDVVEMQQRLSGSGAEMSLDTPLYSSSGESENRTTHLDTLEDETELADEKIAKNQLVKILKNKIQDFQKTLNEKELKILADRLLSEEPKTLQEIADQYGLTRERARQIEAKIIQKLREFLKLGGPS